MKTTVRVSMFVSALAAAFVSFNAFAHNNNNGGGGGNNRSCKMVTVSETKTGPAAYHETYGKINATLVTVEDFKIRTEDGQVIFVDSAPVEVNLQDLSGFSKGFRLDLTNVAFPGGAQTIQVAEIEVNVRAGNNRIQSTDGTSCVLASIPGMLNFYTAAPIALGHDAYHVKVSFTALNAIQLNVITKVTAKQCCDKDCRDGKRAFTSGHGGSGGGEQNCSLSEEKTEVRNQCKLVNRRSLIPSIPLAVDDDF